MSLESAIFLINSEGVRLMQLFEKPFECQTHKSIEQCKAIILEHFPKRKAVASSNILLASLSEDVDSISFSLMQSRIRGFYIKLNASAISRDSKIQIIGKVGVSIVGLLLLTYFLIVSLVLTIIFRPVPWLSLLFLIMFGVTVSYIVQTFRNRNRLVKIVCNLLSN